LLQKQQQLIILVFVVAATGMAARSGIVGLLGLGVGAIGATAGHIAAGLRKS